MFTSYGSGQYATGEAHVAILNRGYKPDGTKRPVVWCHSYNANALEPVNSTNPAVDQIRAVTDVGFPILSADVGGISAWGNDTAQARLTDALAYIRSSFGASASLKPILMGVSMGGLLALNWARANPTLVQAVALFFPVVDLQAVHDGTGGATAFTSQTETAYGGSLAAFNAAVAAHNPAQNAASYAGLPVKMWYSTTDTVVGTANQTAFAAAVGGSAFTATPIGAATHNDMTQVPAAELASFVQSNS